MFWFKKSDVFVLPDRYFQPVLRDFWVKNGHIGTFYTKPATQENQEFDMSAWQNMQISLGFYAGRDTNPCHENSIFPPFAAAMSGAVFSLGNRKCAIVFPSHPTPPQPTLRKPHSTKGTMAQENPPQGCRNRRKARKGEAEDAAEVIRAAANTDINIIFGAVVNEALSDEAIVTVIATGFETDSEPLYQPYGANKEKIEVLSNEDDDDDLPPFLRNRDI